MMLVEHGFWIEEIHLTRRAIHEELDDGFRFCREVWRPRIEIVDPARLFLGYGSAGEQIFGQQSSQCGSLQPVYRSLEEGTAGYALCTVRLRLHISHVNHFL